MNPEIEEQIRKVNRFNENDSNKMIEIKKILSSKLTLITFIVSIVVLLLYFAVNMINQLLIVEEITFPIVLSSIGDNLLNCVFPGIFVFHLGAIYIRAKNDAPSDGRTGLLNKIFSFRSYAKFYFIVNIIGFASSTFTYLNLDNLVSQYPELFQQFAELDLQLSSMVGIYFLILTGLYTSTWYSLSRTTKRIFSGIVLDTDDFKSYDLIIFICFLILIPVLESIGTVLALCGINNPLTAMYFTQPLLVSDFMYLIYCLVNVGLSILIGIIFIKIKNVLVTVKGSNNVLNDDDIVYTIKLEEDDK